MKGAVHMTVEVGSDDELRCFAAGTRTASACVAIGNSVRVMGVFGGDLRRLAAALIEAEDKADALRAAGGDL